MERNKKIVRTSILGIVVNIILVAFKAVVGLIANSIAIKKIEKGNNSFSFLVKVFFIFLA